MKYSTTNKQYSKAKIVTAILELNVLTFYVTKDKISYCLVLFLVLMAFYSAQLTLASFLPSLTQKMRIVG